TPYVRGNALTIVGRLGGKEHIAALEPFLADTTAVANFVQQQRLVAAGGAGKNQTRPAQHCDLGLAMKIHLSGQKPADFGYEMTRTNPNALFSCPYLGFPDDAARANARRKWKEWLDKNKEEKK